MKQDLQGLKACACRDETITRFCNGHGSCRAIGEALYLIWLLSFVIAISISRKPDRRGAQWGIRVDADHARPLLGEKVYLGQCSPGRVWMECCKPGRIQGSLFQAVE